MNSNNFSELWQNEAYVKRYNQAYNISSDECRLYLQLLQLNSSDTFGDFGCGAGDFFKHAIPLVKSAVAIDQSGLQLERLKADLAENDLNINNLKKTLIIEKTFLELGSSSILKSLPLFTKAFARASLHHLKLEEKKSFFTSIKDYFANGSLFLLHDMVFEFPLSELNCNTRIEQLLLEAKNHYGADWERKQQDIKDTWFKEYPEDLQTWQAVFECAGFILLKRVRITSFISMLLFIKKLS